MAALSGARLLCFLLLTFLLSWLSDASSDVRRKNATVLIQTKSRRLFARQKTSSAPLSRSPKQKSRGAPPARRCSRLTDSCSSTLPCCEPCASCRCRLFNSVCHCWRVTQVCVRKA